MKKKEAQAQDVERWSLFVGGGAQEGSLKIGRSNPGRVLRARGGNKEVQYRASRIRKETRVKGENHSKRKKILTRKKVTKLFGRKTAV